MADLPDSGNPADFSEAQLEAMDGGDKSGLTKNQRAAIARWKFQKAKAAKEAAGGAAPAAAPAAATPAAAPKPEPVAAKAEPKGPSAEEKALEAARAKAADFAAVKALRAAFPDAVADATMQTDKPAITIKSHAWRDVLAHARTRLGFTYLNNLTAADYPPDRMEVVVNVQNLVTREYLAAKVVLPRENPSVASLYPVWGGADWLEREVFDMFGIRFDGHPNMKRLLLPEGWIGYPLRKDYDMTREQFIAMDDRGEDVVSFKEDAGW